VAERLELTDEAFGEAVGVLAGEVVAAEAAVELAGLEHVPGGGQDRVADGGDGLWVAAAAAQALVLGGQVGVLGSSGGERGLGQRRAQPLGALAGLAGAAFAGGAGSTNSYWRSRLSLLRSTYAIVDWRTYTYALRRRC